MKAIQKKSVQAGKFVNTEHVDAVIKNYKEERWVHNSKRLGKKDTLSIWYSLEELEEFIFKAKNHGSNGIRLYFGAYDRDHAPHVLYAERQTIVMVATKQRVTEAGGVNKDIYILTEKGSAILAYNVGHLCPPFCSGNDDMEMTIVDSGKEGMFIA